MSPTERLFFGVPLDEAARAALVTGLGDRLARSPGIRAVAPAAWHVTLRFLGDTPAQSRACVGDGLAQAELPTSFDLRFTRAGAFPRPTSARVLWVGIEEPTGALLRLHHAAETAARACGFPPERKRFTPHLTVGRLRAPADVADLLAELTLPTVDMRVDRVALFRSTLSPSGATYDIVRSIRLPG